MKCIIIIILEFEWAPMISNRQHSVTYKLLFFISNKSLCQFEDFFFDFDQSTMST